MSGMVFMNLQNKEGKVKKLNYLDFLSILSISAVLIFSYFTCGPVLAESGSSSEAKKEGVLPSWNDGQVKEAILGYVKKSTTTDSENFIEEEDRIAVFRANGTLICEDPDV